jgi:predicted RNase H-like nuclease
VQVLGVDAAGRWGWVGVVADDHGFVSADVAATVAELIERVEQQHAPARLSAIGVDIPIGLADAATRRVDRLMRDHVGPRRSSVFPAPHPSIIDLEDHAEAVAVLRAQGLPGISRQGFNLIPRIREVAGLAHDLRVVEVFPESSFRALTGHPLQAGKKSWAGMAERRRLLAEAVPPLRIPDGLGPAGRVPVDDVLDAAAAAWTAWRVANGTAERFGDPAQADAASGRPIAVWV